MVCEVTDLDSETSSLLLLPPHLILAGQKTQHPHHWVQKNPWRCEGLSPGINHLQLAPMTHQQQVLNYQRSSFQPARICRPVVHSASPSLEQSSSALRLRFSSFLLSTAAAPALRRVRASLRPLKKLVHFVTQCSMRQYQLTCLALMG